MQTWLSLYAVRRGSVAALCVSALLGCERAPRSSPAHAAPAPLPSPPAPAPAGQSPAHAPSGDQTLGSAAASAQPPAAATSPADGAGRSEAGASAAAACGRCDGGLECMVVGDVARCVEPLDFEALHDRERWQGRWVGIRARYLFPLRTCTKMACPSDGCCNKCTAGFLAFTSSSGSVTPLRNGARLSCAASMDCEHKCGMSPGHYDVIGKLPPVSQGVKHDGHWTLEVLAIQAAGT